MKNGTLVGNLAVLGSTGSVGTQTLDVVRRNPGRFSVIALTAHSNIELLVEQVKEFSPKIIAVTDESAVDKLHKLLRAVSIKDLRVLCADSGLREVVSDQRVHTVVAAISGFSCLSPIITAIECGKHIALANKEALVAAGSIVKQALAKSKSVLVPVDSEHSSIFRCLQQNGKKGSVKRIILTASGGPFLNLDPSEYSSLRPEDAIKHPRWNMGAKISIDSATLMNKGLEVIEASVLFDLEPGQIEVLIHPQSIVHGMVEYEDGALMALMFEPDMRVPISYALEYLSSFGSRSGLAAGAINSGARFLNLAEVSRLDFISPSSVQFPALPLCYEMLSFGQGAPCVLNAANEVAVTSYLREEISFPEITVVVREICAGFVAGSDRLRPSSVQELCRLDAWARDKTSKMIRQLQ